MTLHLNAFHAALAPSYLVECFPMAAAWFLSKSSNTSHYETNRTGLTSLALKRFRRDLFISYNNLCKYENISIVYVLQRFAANS
jgi:hypothetical protein